MSTPLTTWLRPARRARAAAPLAGLERLEARDVPNATPHDFSTLPGFTNGYFQDWSNIGQITADNNWATPPSVQGFSGAGMAAAMAGDPRTVTVGGTNVAPDNPLGTLQVVANQANPNTLMGSGLAEFDGLADPVVALRQPVGASGSPFLLFNLNTATVPTTQTVQGYFLLRDIQSSASGSPSVSVQWRIFDPAGTAEVPFAPVPATLPFTSFVGDGTAPPASGPLGPDIPVFFRLPAAASGVAGGRIVQVRVITTATTGTPEWVGVDYIGFAVQQTTNAAGPAHRVQPVVGLGGPNVTYNEGTALRFAASGGTVTDDDSANFDGGTLTVDMAAGRNAAQDVLGVNTEGLLLNQISFNAGTREVSYNFGAGPVVIATRDVANDGATGGPMEFTLSANATPVSVAALVRNLTYRNTSDTPDITARVMRAVMSDGDGARSFFATTTININPINDAPVVNPDPGNVGPVFYLLNTAPVLVAPTGTITDPDEASAPDLKDGKLTVRVIDNGSSPNGISADNRLTVRSSPAVAPNTIAVDTSGNISYRPPTFGGPNPEDQAQIVARIASSGRGTQPLVIDFNSVLVTPAVATLILRNVTFETVNTSFTLADRRIEFRVTDGDGVDQTTVTNTPVPLLYDSFNTTRTIVTRAANTDPSFAVPAAANAVSEDAGSVTQANFATAVSPGIASYETGQALTFNVTVDSDPNGLFAVAPAITRTPSPTGGTVATLTYTLNPNVAGTATLSVTLSDDGAGTFLGAGFTSAPQQFTITVNPVADTAGVTNASTTEDVQTASGLVITPNAVDTVPNGSPVTHFQITNIRNGTLFQNDGTTPIAAGAFITTAQAGAGLKFTPAQDRNDNNTPNGIYATPFGFDVQASLSASAAGLGGGVVTADVSVLAQNDNPVLGGIGGTIPYLVTSPAIVVAAGATVADPDNALDGADFAGGALAVVGGGTNDTLAIRNQGSGAGQVGVSGADVSYEGTVIGTFAGGAGGASLVVTFTAAATRDGVEAVVRNVTFASVAVSGPRTIGFTLLDGDGGTSNVPTVTVNVTDEVTALTLVRSSPVLNPGARTAASVLTWTLTTDLPTSGFSGSNFSFGGTLAGQASVTNVTAGPATSFTITVTVTGSPLGDADGTLQLILDNDLGVNPLVSNADAAPGGNDFPGETYTLDRTGPVVTGFADDDADDVLALGQVVTFTVTFGEAVDPASVDAADFDNAGTAGVTVGTPTVSMDGLTVTVPVTATAAGTIVFRVRPDAVITDDLGNDDPDDYANPDALTVDGVFPTVTMFANDTAGPVANVTAPNTAVTYTLTFNEDIDAATLTAASLSNAGTAPVTFGVVTETAPGVVTVVVTPTAIGTLQLRVGAGFVRDVAGNLKTAIDTDTTTVTVNRPPVGVADSYTVAEGNTLTVLAAAGLLANDTDPNITTPNGVTDALTADTTTVLAGPNLGTLVLNANGSFTFTPSGADVFGTTSYQYTVRDQFGGSATGTVTIAVTNVNDPPTFTQTQTTFTAAEDSGQFPATQFLTNLTVGGTAPFTDPDTFQATLVTQLTIDPTLSFSVNPIVSINAGTGTATVTFTPGLNAYGTATFQFTVRDTGATTPAPNANSATGTFTITITPVNDPPTFTLAGNPPISAEDGGAQAVPLFAAFNPGPNETGQTPVYTLTVLPNTGTLRFAAAPLIDAAGTLRYTAAPDSTGTATVQVTAADSDGASATATRTFVITVRAQNDLPIANNDSALVPQDSPGTRIDVLVNDTPDPDGSEFLTVVSVGAPANGTAAVAPGGRGVVYTPTPGFSGTDAFTYTINDGNGGPATATVTVTVRPIPVGQPLFDIIAVGSGPGGGPVVRVNSLSTGSFTSTFAAYDPSFRGGVNVGIGDVNGDGVPDVVVTPGFGGGPHVKVLDGRKLGLVGPDGGISPAAELASFFAYAPDFRGGVTVTVADINGDGRAEIITGTGPGGGAHVKVFDIVAGRELASFFAFDPSFRGGVNVAAGDVNGDGVADIVAAAASGGGSHVKVFDGLGGLPLLRSFFAYAPDFTGGVSVAAGDVNGDGIADIITGAGVGGGPHVKVFDGMTGAELASFLGLDGRAAGADVAYRVTREGVPLVVVGGQTGGSQVRAFSAPEFLPFTGFDAYENSFLGGVEVG